MMMMMMMMVMPHYYPPAVPAHYALIHQRGGSTPSHYTPLCTPNTPRTPAHQAQHYTAEQTACTQGVARAKTRPHTPLAQSSYWRRAGGREGGYKGCPVGGALAADGEVPSDDPGALSGLLGVRSSCCWACAAAAGALRAGVYLGLPPNSRLLPLLSSRLLAASCEGGGTGEPGRAPAENAVGSGPALGLLVTSGTRRAGVVVLGAAPPPTVAGPASSSGPIMPVPKPPQPPAGPPPPCCWATPRPALPGPPIEPCMCAERGIPAAAGAPKEEGMPLPDPARLKGPVGFELRAQPCQLEAAAAAALLPLLTSSSGG